jgi:hypothetical protein
MNNDQDVVLLQSDQANELQQRLVLHTIPLYFFRGSTDGGRCSSSGSGVLVKLGGRYFILTAGHCVREAGAASTDAIVLGMKMGAHRFEPNLHGRGDSLARGIDVGYFEVPSADAATIESLGSRVFLSENSLCVASGDVMSGYPSAIIDGDKSRNPGAKMLVYSTTIAGTGDAPESRLEPKAGRDELDLWIPQKGNVDTLNEAQQTVTVPELRGSSGGGCWKAGVRPHQDQPWDVRRIRLVGIHTGSCDSMQIGAETHTFAREHLLAHFLRLIAHDYPDLRSHILEKSPDVDLYN